MGLERILFFADCFVTKFKVSRVKYKRKSISHYAERDVAVRKCKWLCDRDESCKGIDVSDDFTAKCYLHNLPEEQVQRSQTETASLRFHTAHRQCGMPPFDNNYKGRSKLRLVCVIYIY